MKIDTKSCHLIITFDYHLEGKGVGLGPPPGGLPPGGLPADGGLCGGGGRKCGGL